jgi:hypothetical protein
MSSRALPVRVVEAMPPVADRAQRQAELDGLLVREKARTLSTPGASTAAAPSSGPLPTRT